jgi:hypothetical protein
MSTPFRPLALALALAAGALASPALAQPTHEIKGKIVQLEASPQHVVVEEGHGRKYRQPLAVGAESKIVLPSGPGTLDQLHVNDEVVVTYHAGATGPEIGELRVTKPAAP